MNELNVSRTCISFNEFYQPAYSQCINTLYVTGIMYHPQCLRSQHARLGNVRLRHSGFRSRKRRTAWRLLRSFTTTCSTRKHRVFWFTLPIADRSNEEERYTLRQYSSHKDRMKNNATSGLPLSICVSVCALMVLLSITDTAYAKRE